MPVNVFVSRIVLNFAYNAVVRETLQAWGELGDPEQIFFFFFLNLWDIDKYWGDIKQMTDS